MTGAAQKPAVPQASNQPTPIRNVRLTLASIQKGRVETPCRILIHGVDGVGKTTFGAGAPEPLFLGTEDGTDSLDVARFPSPTSWEDLMDGIRALTETPSAYKTLVIDSLDWAEPLLWRYVCEQNNVKSIEDVGGGFGKGYQAALDVWRVFLAALERLQREREMHLVLIAHSFIKVFRNPEGDDFDRYILKLHEKSAALIREWCKGVYFANYETFAVKDKAKRVRGVSTGARLLYTQRTAAWDAKDRYGLPESLPLSWDEFDAAAKREQPVEPSLLKQEIERKLTSLGGELEKSARGALARAGGDATKLAQLNSWANAKLAEKAEREA